MSSSDLMKFKDNDILNCKALYWVGYYAEKEDSEVFQSLKDEWYDLYKTPNSEELDNIKKYVCFCYWCSGR